MWSHGYDASLGSLPSAQGFVHQLTDPPPNDLLTEGNYSVVVSALVQGDTGGPNTDPGNTQWYESVPPIFDFDRDEMVVDLRLKIVASTLNPPGGGAGRAGFGVTLVDSGRRMVTLYVGETGAFISGGVGESGLHAMVTTDGFHDYRLQVDGGGVSLEVDGAPAVSAAYDDLGISGPPGNVLRFGDLSALESSSSEIESLVLSAFHPLVVEVRQYIYKDSFAIGGASSQDEQTVGSYCQNVGIGGGVEIIGADGMIGLRRSGKRSNGTEPGWEAEAREIFDTDEEWELRVSVVCAEVPGSTSGKEPTLSGTNAVKTGTDECSDPYPILAVHVVGAFVQSERLALRAMGPVSETEGQVELRNFSIPAGAWSEEMNLSCSDMPGFHRLTEATASDSTSPKAYTVVCPAETYPISGGARILGADTQTVLRGIYPQEFLNPDLPIGWTGEAEEVIPTNDPWSLEVSVVCAPLAEPLFSRTGLVGRFKGEFNAADWAGDNEGTLRNGASTDPGVFGEAFSLDEASNQWVEIPGAEFYPDASFTVATWIETTTLQPGTVTEVVNLSDAGGLGGFNLSAWGLRLDVNGHPTAFFRDKFGPTATVLGPAPGAVSLADGQPHHLALLRDSDLKRAQLYVDGLMVVDDSISTTNSGVLEPAGPPDPVAVGILRDSGATTLSRGFHGLIDDFKFYDRALLAEEIHNEVGCVIPLLPRTLNVDATRFSGRLGSTNEHKLCTMLEAGIYIVTLVNPTLDPTARFTAWSPGPETFEGPLIDWGTAYRVDTEIEGPFAAGIPVGSSPTPMQAFDDTSNKVLNLVLTVDQNVWFSVIEDDAKDNAGGVSLRVEYVPEPGALAQWLTGFAALVAMSRSKRARSRAGSV